MSQPPPLFTWETRYTLGVTKMDAEHQGLLDQMQKLYDAHLAKAPANAQMALYKRLVDMSVEHFSHEEKHMESIKFEALSMHKIIHKNLIEKLTGFGKDFAKSGVFPANLFEFLKTWLASHIMGIDMKYAGKI